MKQAYIVENNNYENMVFHDKTVAEFVEKFVNENPTLDIQQHQDDTFRVATLWDVFMEFNGLNEQPRAVRNEDNDFGIGSSTIFRYDNHGLVYEYDARASRSEWYLKTDAAKGNVYDDFKELIELSQFMTW